MKRLFNSPGFLTELSFTGNNNYTVNRNARNRSLNEIVPQRRKSPFGSKIKNLENTVSDCSSKRTNCNSGCNDTYPPANDSPDNFNKELRGACKDGCDAAYNLCSNPPA